MQIKSEYPNEAIPLLEHLATNGENLTHDEKLAIGKQIYELCDNRDVYIIRPNITVSIYHRNMLAQDFIVMLAFTSIAKVLVYGWWHL